MKRESTLSDQVMKWLREQPFVYAVKYPGGMYGTKGTPDVLCCINGRFVAFELKSDIGKVTKLQEAAIARIRMSGGTAIVVRTLDAVKNVVYDKIEAGS